MIERTFDIGRKLLRVVWLLLFALGDKGTGAIVIESPSAIDNSVIDWLRGYWLNGGSLFKGWDTLLAVVHHHEVEQVFVV